MTTTTSTLPTYGYPSVMGNEAGFSMEHSDVHYQFGDDAVTVGSRGEKIIAQLLNKWVPSDAVIFPSVKIPGAEADIDFLIVRGNRVLVVDAKYFKSGTIYHSNAASPDYMYENGVQTHRMSHSMDMAVNRLRSLLPGHVVSGVVILAPHHKFSDVSNLVWPGGFSTFYGDEAIPVVRGFLARATGGHQAAYPAACVAMSLAFRNR